MPLTKEPARQWGKGDYVKNMVRRIIAHPPHMGKQRQTLPLRAQRRANISQMAHLMRVDRLVILVDRDLAPRRVPSRQLPLPPVKGFQHLQRLRARGVRIGHQLFWRDLPRSPDEARVPTLQVEVLRNRGLPLSNGDYIAN